MNVHVKVAIIVVIGWLCGKAIDVYFSPLQVCARSNGGDVWQCARVLGSGPASQAHTVNIN